MIRWFLSLNSGVQTLIGAALGICAGLLFGDFAIYLRPIGSLYVMLLEMVVLPYIVFGIIYSIGLFSSRGWKVVIKKISKPFLIIWVLSLLLIMIFVNLIPQTARQPLVPVASDSGDIMQKILSYFVPENPFFALTYNLVPAVTVFSIIIGVTLIRMEKKEKVLDLFSIGVKVILQVFKWLTRLAPLGTFGLLASTVGGITVSEFHAIQYYLLSYVAFVILIVFVVLPLFLKYLVPIKYREIFSTLKTGLIICFATGISVIALPFIQRAAQEFYEKQKESHKQPKDFESIPLISYSFAQIGNVIVILFIFFAGYFYRTPLTETQFFIAPFLGWIASFGSPTTSVLAVKFFSEQWSVSQDATELYVQLMPLTRSFQTLASVMCMYVLTFIGFFSLKEHRKKNRGKFLTLCLAVPLAFLLSFPVANMDLIHIKERPYSYWKTDVNQTVHVHPNIVYLSREEAYNSLNKSSGARDQLSHIKSMGNLRVGYNASVMPFVYWNDQHQLAGFDVAFIYTLAHILDVTVEFIPYEWKSLEADLENKLFDIAIGAIFMTESRLVNAMMSKPYLSTSLVLIAPRDNQSDFTDYEQLQQEDDLTIGVIQDPTWKHIAQKYFPKAEIVEFPSIEEYFESGGDKVSVFMWADETAIAWPTKYPDFAIVNTTPPIGKEFFAYAFKMDSNRLMTFVNYWIDIMRLRNVLERQYKIWILGQPAQEPEPRWSIVTALFPQLKEEAQKIHPDTYETEEVKQFMKRALPSL